MRCDLCPGQSVDKLAVVPLRQAGRTVVVEDVPARVCDICGDRLYSESTVSRLFALIEQDPKGARVPLPGDEKVTIRDPTRWPRTARPSSARSRSCAGVGRSGRALSAMPRRETYQAVDRMYRQ